MHRLHETSCRIARIAQLRVGNLSSRLREPSIFGFDALKCLEGRHDPVLEEQFSFGSGCDSYHFSSSTTADPAENIGQIARIRATIFSLLYEVIEVPDLLKSGVIKIVM
jgi:hypothetical protein